MRQTPLAAVAVLALLTGAASAQTTSPRSTTSPAPTATQAPAPKPAVNPLTREAVSDIEGTAVYGGDNDKIGHVSDVLMDPQTKKLDRLVVSAGGVLGVGGHRVALPIDQFKWDADKGAFKIETTTAQLKSMPEWVDGETTATGSSTPPKAMTPSNSGGSSEK